MKKLLLFFSVFIALGVPFTYGQGININENMVSGIKYMSGGVGLEERAAMEKRADRSYDLKLVFAVTQGNYVAGVNVAVSRNGRVMLRSQSNGPWFYLDLPSGSYKISAVYHGLEKVRQITVTTKGHRQTILFHWKTEESVSP